jgi:hypothetical protein
MNAPRVLTALFAVLVAALALATTAAAERTFADPAGDAGTAPDITQVVVSDGVGLISFLVSVPLAPSTAVALYLNTDRNASTGKDGNEFVVVASIDPEGAKVFDGERWNGSAWEEHEPASLQVYSTASGVEFAFAPSDVGIVDAVAFLVRSLRVAGDTVESFEDAPDGAIPWEYALSKPSPTSPPAPTIAIGKPSTTPLRLLAGRRATVRFPLSGGSTAGAVVSAFAAIGGKKVASTANLIGGAGRVVLVIPRSATGKKLVLRLAVKLGGKTTTRTATIPIANA